jgi:cellular nucleic acid-binding protein
MAQHRMYVAGRGSGFPGSGRGGPRGGFTGPGTGRGFEGDGRLQTCYKCGGPNHFARDCHAKSVKCYACGKFEGHIVLDLLFPIH